MYVKKKGDELSQQDRRRYNGYIWKTVIGCFVIFILLIVFTMLGLFGPLPSFRDLENPKSNTATQVISSDNKVLGTYYIQNRSPVTYKELSPNVVHALVATEDTRFYEHSGIDFSRSFSIILYNLIGKHQGGSTITQQLAKNLFNGGGSHNPFVRFTQKLKEWIISVKLERHYTKEEILTMYLNTVSFGAYNTYGIKSAALTYFNTTPDKLTPDQAALLIGMLNAPGFYSPINHPDRAMKRRNFVLERMGAANYLSSGQVEEFQQKPLGLDFTRIDHNEGLAQYFRAVLKKEVQKILNDKSITKPDGTPYDLDRDGLKIYTTIDATMQQYAEQSQREYMRKLQVLYNGTIKGANVYKAVPGFKDLVQQGIQRSDRYKELKEDGKTDDEIAENFNTPDSLDMFTWRGDTTMIMKPIDSVVFCQLMLRNSLMSMDPTTGYIKAWVGGINFEHFKYDQVKIGTRQVGSTAKPFTYAVAIEQGYSPCQQFNNVPDTVDGWCPHSYDTKPGMLTMRAALGWSQNWITAHIMKLVTPSPVVELIKRMGVNSPNLDPYPSICLGTFDASVFDMTGAYCAFANHGIWTEPTFILRIEDKNGNVLYTSHPQVRQALNEQNAYVMTYLLKGVIQDGTGSRMQFTYHLYNPIGGKTGTTSNNSDGWFIGITPQLVTGVWTGFENRAIHFRSTAFGEGSNTALPIWALYMQKVYANPALGIEKNVDFDAPKGGVSIQLDCNQYNQQQQQNPAEADKKLEF
ncbi:MAG: transglycosylase domain-containing protein [Mucilaginibacter sp.]